MTNERNAPACVGDDAEAALNWLVRQVGSRTIRDELVAKQAARTIRAALSSPPAAGDAVAWLVMYRGKPVGYATHETRDDVRLAECETLLPVFASPAAPPPGAGEFTNTSRAALAWVLYHHQGGNSAVGQPIRFALGMGEHEPLSETQISEAKRYAAMAGASTANFRAAAPKPATSVGSSVDDVIELLEEMQTDRTVLLHFSDTAQARIRNGLAALVSYLSGLETVAHRITSDEGEDDALVALQRYAEQREAAAPKPAAPREACTEPDRANCPRLCMDFCNKAETEKAAPPSVTDAGVDLCEVARELERVHVAHVIGEVAAIAGERTDPYWSGHSLACEEIAHRLELADALTHPGHKPAQEGES